jgi:cyclic pyranopterin phosphate synthase
MTNEDSFHRLIDYLRISITDRCNLRCIYCMPEEGIPSRLHDEILRYEEIETIARAAAELGITRIRLTGGEPLARLGVVDLVRMLAQIPGIEDLSMTTNGTLLSRYAQSLAQAGLNRVNVSLDTLSAERFRRITRRGDLHDVLEGLDAARAAGLEPVKINTVIIRGVNDDEVVALARWALDRGWTLRFIEWMPIGDAAQAAENTITAQEIRAQIEAALGKAEPVQADVGTGPARYVRLPGKPGKIGFITPISEHFCDRCNRLRLTADGQLRLCLLNDREIDLRTPLRAGAGIAEIKELIALGIQQKPRQHYLHDAAHASPDAATAQPTRQMSQIGG